MTPFFIIAVALLSIRLFFYILDGFKDELEKKFNLPDIEPPEGLVRYSETKEDTEDPEEQKRREFLRYMGNRLGYRHDEDMQARLRAEEERERSYDLQIQKYLEQAEIERKKAEAEEKYRLMKSGVAEALSMSGLDFEKYCASLLEKNGFRNVKVTPASGDHGVDIIANKDNAKYVVQCKRYKNPVGFDAVKEVFTGKAIYEADKAVIMTTSRFTDQAIRDAHKLGVELWDRKKLMEYGNG